MNKNQITKYLNQIVRIDWFDATCATKVNISEVKNILPFNLLEKTSTYGRLYKTDKDATIILTEESSIEYDYTVIPNSWIINITKL